MAQQARVPKFGNWESDGSVPYTQYFDNARKGRTAGKLINPNDPSENPEAFPEELPPVHARPFRSSSDQEAPKPRDSDARRFADAPLRHDSVPNKPSSDSPHHRYGDRGNPGDPQKKVSRISGGSDRSIEHSPLHPTHHAKTGSKGSVSSPTWERRGSSEGHGLAPNTPGRTRMRPGGRGDEIPEKGSAVPKFGEWDESNPSSADGFTHIFNKVREERQVGGTRVPAASNEHSYPNGQRRDTSYESKGCGCFSWFKK